MDDPRFCDNLTAGDNKGSQLEFIADWQDPEISANRRKIKVCPLPSSLYIGGRLGLFEVREARNQVLAPARQVKINKSVVIMFRLVLLVSLVVLIPRLALAYVDPGTGSFVIQGIIAAVVGAGVAIKMFWHRIKGALGGKSEQDDLDDYSDD